MKILSLALKRLGTAVQEEFRDSRTTIYMTLLTLGRDGKHAFEKGHADSSSQHSV